MRMIAALVIALVSCLFCAAQDFKITQAPAPAKQKQEAKPEAKKAADPVCANGSCEVMSVPVEVRQRRGLFGFFRSSRRSSFSSCSSCR